MNLSSIDLPSIEIMLLVGRAAFLVFSFVLAAFAFTRWRRAAARDTERVSTEITALNDRLAGVEERLASIDLRFAELARLLDEPARTAQPSSGASPSYPIAIRLARNGATCEELMESCGLGRQEAELVGRLHGPSKRTTRTQSAAA